MSWSLTQAPLGPSGINVKVRLTDRLDAEVEAELGRQLLVGLQSPLEIDDLQVF